MKDDERDDDVLLDTVRILGVEDIVARLPGDCPSMLEMDVLEPLCVEVMVAHLPASSWLTSTVATAPTVFSLSSSGGNID